MRRLRIRKGTKDDSFIEECVKEAKNITGVVCGEFPKPPGRMNRRIGRRK
ncbi:hypothetical protein [Thermohalobacter berrensis]|nr:hypothetical protein [Thermohalobacter berrensis]